MELASHPLFAAFDPVEAAELVNQAQRVELAPRAALFEENDPADSVYLVLDGRVELTRRLAGQDVAVLSVAQAGDYFGEVALLDGSGRSTSARAEETAVVARIPGPVFLRALRESPGRAALILYRKIVEDIRATNDRYLTERLNREKMHLVGEMAGSIVHDLRVPYSGIKLAVEMIREQHADPETAELCGLVQEQIDRSLGMLDELLQYARGTSSLKKQRVGLGDLVERFRRLNRDFFAQAGVALDIRVPNEPVDVDQDKMLRVLQNLVNNSIEAVGSRPARIALAAQRIQRWVELELTDNGPGIPAAIRDRLFQPFVTHGKANGTGLGMAITKSVVEGHRGTISVRSSGPEGTTFLIRLPAV